MQRDQDLLSIDGKLDDVRKAMDRADELLRSPLERTRDAALQAKRDLIRMQVKLLSKKRRLEANTA